MGTLVVYSQNTRAKPLRPHCAPCGGGSGVWQQEGLPQSSLGHLTPRLVAGAPSTGCTQASVHRQIPAAWGTAGTAGDWPGARHAEVPTHDTSPGAADTYGKKMGS
jgi:hypothetical protein